MRCISMRWNSRGISPAAGFAGWRLRLTRSAHWDKRLVNGHRLKHQRFQRLQRNHRRVFILNGHGFIAAVYRFQTKLRHVSCRYFEILSQIQIVGLWLIRWVAQTENGFVFAPGMPSRTRQAPLGRRQSSGYQPARWHFPSTILQPSPAYPTSPCSAWTG